MTTQNNKKINDRHRVQIPKLQVVDGTAVFEEISSIIQNKQAVITIDFNCPNIDWNSMYGDQEGNRLVEMVEDAFLTQIVNQPRG